MLFFYNGYGLSIVLMFTGILAAREYLTFKGNISAKYILTPLITLTITGMVIFSIFIKGPSTWTGLILIALCCALIADTLLMVVEVSLLKYGLIFFLLTHVFYAAAFSEKYSFQWWNTALAAVLIAYIIIFYQRIKDTVGQLKIPVLIYMGVLSVMVFFAVSSLGNGGNGGNGDNGCTVKNIFTASGAVLFAVSDSILATNEFIKKIPHSTVYTWATYAPAQMLIALSCLH